MAEQFHDQGGTATMDPNPVMRWLASRLMTTLFSEERQSRKHATAERKRVAGNHPHRIEYFHQVDDGYSYLAAQLLPQLAARYDVELECHLVRGPEGGNAAEPELLLRLSRYESFHTASGYGLTFPEHPDAPNPVLVEKASAILAAQNSQGFVDVAARLGAALWAGDVESMDDLARLHGEASPADALAKTAAGTKRRARLKHYSGGMFYYGGEWYWGVERLYHLEARLAALGADMRPGEPMIAPRPDLDVAPSRESGQMTLEFFPSLRSPYTAIAFERTLDFAHRSGVNLVVRPVLPMVMRGVPATREKGMYIFMDVAREARAAGIEYGKFYDPIGDPVRRCYSIYPWAVEQGKGTALLGSFLRHAFALGVNTNNDRGLRKVVEGAGLDWREAKTRLGDSTWKGLLEANRLAMYEAGLWGVPSYRLLDADGNQLLALWGQDRLWVVAQAINQQPGDKYSATNTD